MAPRRKVSSPELIRPSAFANTSIPVKSTAASMAAKMPSVAERCLISLLLSNFCLSASSYLMERAAAREPPVSRRVRRRRPAKSGTSGAGRYIIEKILLERMCRRCLSNVFP